MQFSVPAVALTEAARELTRIGDITAQMVHDSCSALTNQDTSHIRLYWQTRQSHIRRLEEGVCQPEADVIFTETLRNLERISDHADNLGVSVARSFA